MIADMVSQISFITGNRGKFEEAQKIFSNTEITLIQEKFDTPEIQSENVVEIVKFSAEYVGRKLEKPLFVMDRGFYIESLNGFPGPFVKFINNWLSSDQILKMLDGVGNRKAYWLTVLGLYIPRTEVNIFVGRDSGTVPQVLAGDFGYMADKLFIPEGSSVALSQMNKEKYDKFWESTSCWNDLIDYLTRL